MRRIECLAVGRRWQIANIVGLTGAPEFGVDACPRGTAPQLLIIAVLEARWTQAHDTEAEH